MSLKITDDTIFYLLVPANVHTGGPEDLHHLGLELQILGKKVFMHYFPENINNPVHENYKIYNIPHTNKVIDNEKNILIIGENNNNIQISKKYKNIQKVLWWLSLDYYFISNFNSRFPKFLRSIYKLPMNLINLFNRLSNYNFTNLSYAKYLKCIYLNYPFKNMLRLKEFKLNLSQSYYQYNVLNNKEIKSELLFDYIRNEFFERAKEILLEDKRNIVCYNPVKSSAFMDKIIEANPDIEFIPLKNYNMDELIKILSESKIYMDFGFHPGVDHLPREAAILKNCVITNKEGSAFYHEAVPINENFKFEEKRKNIILIRKKIDKIFNDFETQLEYFDNYRKKLQDEKNIFKKQVIKIFN